MSKAFIFDFDGVMINDENIWNITKEKIYKELFGDEICNKLGNTTGIHIFGIHEKALGLGAKVSKDDFMKAFDKAAPSIYQNAPLTPDLSQLIDKLKELNFVIGIVSVSPKEWIDIATNRMSFKKDIKYILSLHNRNDLRNKPYPDGYIEAIRQLQSSPRSTIILEDSNTGIASAKAAGVYTIALKENITKGATQNGADAYAENIYDVINIVEKYIVE